MRNAIICWTAVSLGLCTGSVNAQGYIPGGAPGSRPVFSPYLNLLRTGSPLVNNYYGLVRPEFNFRDAIQQLDQQQLLTTTQQTTIENSLSLPPTGHASQFLTQSKYFLNKGGLPTGSRFVGPTGGAPGVQPGIQGASAPKGVPR